MVHEVYTLTTAALARQADDLAGAHFDIISSAREQLSEHSDITLYWKNAGLCAGEPKCVQMSHP